MSKPLGNLVMISDLLQDWSADSIRLYLGRHHYRHPWSHDAAELRDAAELSHRISEAVTAVSQPGAILDTEEEEKAFIRSLDDDLDTPSAMKSLAELADAVIEGVQAGLDVTSAQKRLREFCRIFGLQLDTGGPEARVVNGWNRHLERFLG